MDLSKMEREMERPRPTAEEVDTLLDAQKDFIERGNTSKKCPRCGKSLEYRQNNSGSAVYCMDEKCVITYTRGI